MEQKIFVYTCYSRVKLSSITGCQGLMCSKLRNWHFLKLLEIKSPNEEQCPYLGCGYEKCCFLLKWQEIRMEMETSFWEIMIWWQMMMKSWHHDNLVALKQATKCPSTERHIFYLCFEVNFIDIKLQFYVPWCYQGK